MKKLIAPRLPEKATPEDREALRQLVANGMRPPVDALPEGITTELVTQGFIDRLQNKLNRKIKGRFIR
jgi:hypothetical protein